LTGLTAGEADKVRFLGRQYSLDGRKRRVCRRLIAPEYRRGLFFFKDGTPTRSVTKKQKEGSTMTENDLNLTISKNRARIRWIAKTGILSAVAIALMYLEMSLPLMPAFLKFDFSEIAVLLGSFAMGPLTGILIELIKNLAHLPASGTMYVGELANFVVGVLFVGTAGWIYQRHKTRSRAYLAMAAGTLAMTVGASLINYFLMIPFYVSAMGFPMEAIINMTHKAGNLMVSDLKSLILWVFVPFNLFKGIIVSFIVGLVYKRVSPLLHR
jgi:riboflavin transporter FmnP